MRLRGEYVLISSMASAVVGLIVGLYIGGADVNATNNKIAELEESRNRWVNEVSGLKDSLERCENEAARLNEQIELMSTRWPGTSDVPETK